MGHIREYYERIVRLKDAEWEFISSCFHRKEYVKGETITTAGTVENFLSFIETGLVRYYIPNEEDGLTFHFSFDKEFTCAYDSFLTRNPSEYALQALTYTTLWQIGHTDLQKVYERTHAGNRIGRFASEKLFLEKSKRELFLLKYTATERYLCLLDEQPELIRSIPLKYIASYIGITPQGLSRIRKQIS